MEQRILILTSGLLAVALFDAVGSVVSRKYKINLGVLSMISFFIYLGVGCWSGYLFDNITGITMTALVGLFDATIGWKIFTYLKADFGDFQEVLEKEIQEKELGVLTVVSMTFASALIGWIGAFVGQVLQF